MKVNQSGRSMIEMLGVLAIVGVLSVGALAGYSMAMSKHKANVASGQLEQIVFDIIDLYETSDVKSPKEITQDVLVQAGILPDDLLNVYGMSIKVGFTDTSIMLTFMYPDKSDCISILSSQSMTNIGSHIVVLTGNEVVAGPYSWGTDTKSFPLALSDVSAVCNIEEKDLRKIGLLVHLTGEANATDWGEFRYFL